jgi:hypothetical protein
MALMNTIHQELEITKKYQEMLADAYGIMINK